MNKGISPLIASVLLIAFVIAIAGIASNWFITFSKEQTEKSVTKGEKQITCSYSGLEIREAKYNTTSKKLRLEVENTGSESLTEFKIQVIYNNDTSSAHEITEYETTLEEGQIRIFNNKGSIDSNIDKFSVYSEDCPVRSKVWLESKYMETVS